MRTLPHCQWWYVTLPPILKEGFMLVRSAAFWATTLGAIWLVAPVSGAHALTMKECSAKYKAAQDSGTLKGMKWNDFRKAECGSWCLRASHERACCRCHACCRAAPGDAPCRDSRHPSGRDPRARGRRRCVPVRSLLEVFERVRRQGPDAHVPRSIQCEQGRQRQWRPEMDREGRRLLQ